MPRFVQSKLVVLVAAVGVIALTGPTAWAVDQVVSANVAVIVPISIDSAVGPDFGTVLKDDSLPCTYRLSPGNTLSVEDGPCAILPAAGNTAGSFEVNGDAGMTAAISAVVTNANCDGATNVTLDSVILRTGPDGNALSGESINKAFPVGAKLTVKAAANPGNYSSCNFTITATYE